MIDLFVATETFSAPDSDGSTATFIAGQTYVSDDYELLRKYPSKFKKFDGEKPGAKGGLYSKGRSGVEERAVNLLRMRLRFGELSEAEKVQGVETLMRVARNGDAAATGRSAPAEWRLEPNGSAGHRYSIPDVRSPDFNVRNASTDIYDLSGAHRMARSPDDETRILRENAMRAMERAEYPTVNADQAKAHIEHLMNRFRQLDAGVPPDQRESNVRAFSKRILMTGSAFYEQAFGRWLTGRGLDSDETRALSLTNTQGGFAVPFTLDPTIIHTSNYSVNPYRTIARLETIATTAWQPITSTGFTVSRGNELTEASDNAPTIGRPTITPQRIQGFIPFDYELGQDWGSLQSEMTSLLQEAKDDEEATSFTTGTGTAPQAQGILTGATTLVTSAGTGAFAVADIYVLEEALPARYKARSQFVANRSFYNKARQLDTGGGGSLWMGVAPLAQGLKNEVPSPGYTGYELIGYPAYECSAMATAGGVTGTLLAVLGDWRYFVVVDRVGMDVELIPQMMGPNLRPVGQRGLYAIWRNDSRVLLAGAFRVLIQK